MWFKSTNDSAVWKCNLIGIVLHVFINLLKIDIYKKEIVSPWQQTSTNKTDSVQQDDKKTNWNVDHQILNYCE